MQRMILTRAQQNSKLTVRILEFKEKTRWPIQQKNNDCKNNLSILINV